MRSPTLSVALVLCLAVLGRPGAAQDAAAPEPAQPALLQRVEASLWCSGATSRARGGHLVPRAARGSMRRRRLPSNVHAPAVLAACFCRSLWILSPQCPSVLPFRPSSSPTQLEMATRWWGEAAAFWATACRCERALACLLLFLFSLVAPDSPPLPLLHMPPQMLEAEDAVIKAITPTVADGVLLLQTAADFNTSR